MTEHKKKLSSLFAMPADPNFPFDQTGSIIFGGISTRPTFSKRDLKYPARES